MSNPIDNKGEQVKIVITGDLCPVEIKDYDQSVLGKLSDIFADSDLNITNLECPLTDCNNKIKKSGPHLKADPEAVNLLKSAKINLVTLANNHLMDYGTDGFTDTITTLTNNGILYVGAGTDITAAKKIKYLEIKGYKLAILNFTVTEFSIAGDDKPGANPIDISENYYQITEAKRNSDYQIVIVHTGMEGYHYPSPNLQKLFRFYANLGVSAVIGHHSHCIGGYELINSVPVFYSLGNFIFNEPGNLPDWYEGLIAELLIDRQGSLTYRTYKFRLECNEAELRLKLIGMSLPELINPDIVKLKWKEYLKEYPRRRGLLNYALRKNLITRIINKYYPSRLKRNADQALLNIIRNENSREYLINVLEDVSE